MHSLRCQLAETQRCDSRIEISQVSRQMESEWMIGDAIIFQLCVPQTKSTKPLNIHNSARRTRIKKKQGRRTVQLYHMHNKLDIMSELYSCREAVRRRFHFHAGLYPSNTFQKEQFVCCGGAFCDQQ